MTSIALIVPTRGRPDNAARLIKGIAETKVTDNVDLYLNVDYDDPELNGYTKLEFPEWVHLIAGDRLRMAGTLNEQAIRIQDYYDILGFWGDDHLPRTHGWDARIADEMIPGGVLYGNDLLQGARIPTAVFLDADIVRTLGYFVPKGFIHLYLDNIWKDWGERTGRLKYFDDLIIEHLHPYAGKAPDDARYQEVNAIDVAGPDEARYHQYVSNGELDEDVRKLLTIK